MDALADQRGAAPAHAAHAPRLLVAIPFYRNAHLVAPCLEGLAACAAELAEANAEIVCYVDSPDHAPLREALAAETTRLASTLRLRIEVNDANLGFVRTMNRAVAEAVATGADLLMLNSDAVLTAGAVAEMRAVAASDHMIGFVNPRSNNATITTLPLAPAQTGDTGQEYLAARAALVARLPRMRFIPTCVGYCMLIAWRVLAEFGGFDEIYGHGYNEENDLVMRAGRCGFRAAMANRAFVWHEGEASIATAERDRNDWERRNRAILDRRYPEYSGYTALHYDAPETVAEQLMAALLPAADGKRDMGFDFSTFRAAHNGTFQAGRQLLAEALAVWGDAFRVHVICSPEVYAFHDYAALGVPRADPHDRRRYAIVFRVGQPYDWNTMERLATAAAVLGIYMLDTISIDCPQLTSARLYNMWQFAIEHADIVVAQSRHTADTFASRFRFPAGAAPVVVRHSLDLADYALPTGNGASRQGRVLVLGNHFHHKYLAPTANALARALPGAEIVALGLATPGQEGALREPALDRLPNLRGVPVGALSDERIGLEYAAAGTVVFPSHAEGFGFPLLNALAARRPVFVRRLPVFLEAWEALGRPRNIHFYDTTAELAAALAVPPTWQDDPTAVSGPGTAAVARDLRAELDAALDRADYWRVVHRVRDIQFVSDMANGREPPSNDRAALAARFLADRVEHVARVMLRAPLLYGFARKSFRLLRRGLSLVRR